MHPIPTAWKPLRPDAIQDLLGEFTDWTLCGGRSIAHFCRKTIREHYDTDIGVMRSSVLNCLANIDPRRVFLCDPPGSITRWDGAGIPDPVHDVWISDSTCSVWVLQILIYDDFGDEVTYRRDVRVRWPKASHSIEFDGVRIVNPIVTLLFKLNRPALEAKDCADVTALIEAFSEQAGTDRSTIPFKLKPEDDSESQSDSEARSGSV